MTEVEAAKLIKVLQEAYPRSEFSEGRIEIYTMMLADLPYPAAQKAVLKLIATSPFLPTIAEIRKTAAELVDPLPSVDEAYEAARRAAQQHSPYSGRNPALDKLHPLVRQALQTVGIETMAYTDQPMIAAAQFRQVYERLKDRELSRRQTEVGLIAEIHERLQLADGSRLQALPGGRSA